jgi:archaellum biogenesis ATPase FlaH
MEEKLKGVPPNSIVLLEIPFEMNQLELIASFLKFSQKDKGIYVSSNRPVSDLIEKLVAYKFDIGNALETGMMCVVDLVSRSIGADEVKRCIYVSSPSELSATQVAIEEAIKRIDGGAGKNWLLVDSISTLLVFSSSGSILQFLHFLVGRLRVQRFNGIIFTVEDSVDERTLSTLRQFCDMVIRL